MMTKDFTSPEATWSRGMIYNFEKGHPFLVHVIKEWYKDNPKGLIGDIKGLLIAKGEEDEYEAAEKERKAQLNSQRERCKIELHNILRKQKRISPNKGSVKNQP
ncbi:hypothetical protein [Roseivirga pacifica]|uniref:hypothetical protein n=1 Tax=Roseivirga pacifica TaxID=1267423 RepID=UPI003BA89190